ncbi:MAG: hypothetical protein GY796_05325 [Chloroflexi bacterium]|nr:hypothetical protein [Chloroflexota bacterium]
MTAIITAIFAIVLYWPILNLPLFFDDLLHIRLVEGMNYANVWLPTETFGFYRPLLFLSILLTRDIFGYYPSLVLHILSVLMHALNAALLVWLVWRLGGSWPRALAAGLLFAAYPFAYQAVVVVGNNIYPILLLLFLLDCHAYLFALSGRRGWWVVTAVLFIVGLLTHELFALFGVLAALAQWAYQGRLEIGDWRLRRPLNLQSLLPNLQKSPYLIFIFSAVLYTIVYQFLPTSGPPAPVGNNALLPRLLYMMQSSIYPLDWTAVRFTTLRADIIILGSLTLLLVLSAWAARKPENWWILLLGWGWWLTAALVIIVTLPTDYVIHGHRLTYLGSVGAVIVWAVLLDALVQVRQVGKVAYTAVLLFFIFLSAHFVRGRLVAYTDITSPVAIFAEVLAERPLDEGVLFINLPSWTAPTQNSFATGVEYVALMGEHLFAEELVRDNLNQIRPVMAVGIPELLSDPGYPYGIHDQTAVETINTDWSPTGINIFISRYLDQGVQTDYAGRLLPSKEDIFVAKFGDFELVDAQAAFCGNQLNTDLLWQFAIPTTELLPTSSVFVQALDSSGNLIAQSDGPPLSLSPTRLDLPPDWHIADQRILEIPAGAAPTTLLVGVYDYTTGERFSAAATTQNPLLNNALSLPVTLCN